jgi:hypothetical protein
MNSYENDVPRSLNDEEPQSLGLLTFGQKVKNMRAQCDNEFVIWQNCGAKRGDLIEIERSKYVAHWVVFIGNGQVIHLLVKNLRGKKKGVIVQDSLEKVAKKCKCRVNNLETAAERQGLKPNQVDAIVELAKQHLDREVDYDPIKINCENFATHCRFGSGDFIPGESGFTEQGLATQRENFVKYMAQLWSSSSSLGTSSKSSSRRSPGSESMNYTSSTPETESMNYSWSSVLETESISCCSELSDDDETTLNNN